MHAEQLHRSALLIYIYIYECVCVRVCVCVCACVSVFVCVWVSKINFIHTTFKCNMFANKIFIWILLNQLNIIIIVNFSK